MPIVFTVTSATYSEFLKNHPKSIIGIKRRVTPSKGILLQHINYTAVGDHPRCVFHILLIFSHLVPRDYHAWSEGVHVQRIFFNTSKTVENLMDYIEK